MELITANRAPRCAFYSIVRMDDWTAYDIVFQ